MPRAFNTLNMGFTWKKNATLLKMKKKSAIYEK